MLKGLLMSPFLFPSWGLISSITAKFFVVNNELVGIPDWYDTWPPTV